MREYGIDSYGLAIFKEDEETVKYIKKKYIEECCDEEINVDDICFTEVWDWLNCSLQYNYASFIGNEACGQFYRINGDEAYEYKAPAIIIETRRVKTLVGVAYNSVQEILDEMKEAVKDIVPDGYICEENILEFIGSEYG